MSDQRHIAAARKAGADYARYGANTDNCHLRHFGTKDLMRAWEAGRDSVPWDERHITVQEAEYRD